MWYALQVATGYELEVACRIEQRAAQVQSGLITRVVTGLKHVARIASRDSIAHTYERVIPSYLFVELDGSINANIYQFLRSIPGIFRIFTTAVPEEEMRRVFAAIEPEVEVLNDDVEETSRKFRRELSKKLLRLWERLKPFKMRASAFFRGLRLFLRVPSREVRKAISSFPPAGELDLLTLLCLLVT
jgi:transcription antitermination factor NusG